MLSADYYTNEGLDCQNKLVTVKLSFKSMAAFGEIVLCQESMCCC